MMTFPTEWKNNPNVPNHQPAINHPQMVGLSLGCPHYWYTMAYPYIWDESKKTFQILKTYVSSASLKEKRLSFGIERTSESYWLTSR
jgi:hypothetical protein